MEKITNTKELREWNDHIPFLWKYTAGVAGERFLSLLKNGSIQASVCRSCNKMFLPPKIFCKDCFIQLTEWKELPNDGGSIYSFTRVKNKAGKDEIVVIVKFERVEGGLLGKFKAGREEPRIGMKVKVVFKPKEERNGSLSDIEYFERS